MGNNRIKTEYDAQRYMLIVIVALVPCFMMGVYVYGLDMLDKMLGGCGLAVLLSWLMGKAAEKNSAKSGTDGTGRSSNIVRGAKRQDREAEYFAAIVTGTLIVFGLPSTIPIWIVLIGVGAAMIPAALIMDKLQADGQSLGQDGAYLFERAIVTASAAQCVLWVLFREEMSTWPLNDFVETRVTPGDVATGMTPLQILSENGDLPGLSRMFIGFISGPCGEVSVAAAIIGGGYLIWKKLIHWVVPVSVIGTIFAASFVYYSAAVPVEELDALIERDVSEIGAALYMAGYQVLAGGAVFGAFFLATAVCLRMKGGKADLPLMILCGIGTGMITVALRLSSVMTEGLALPVLIMYVIHFIAVRVMASRKDEHRETDR